MRGRNGKLSALRGVICGFAKISGSKLKSKVERIWHLAGMALALCALTMPRLITAAPLDLLTDTAAQDDPAEDAGENFAGSAFFFAQGAFDPLPGTPNMRSEHVMALDAVEASPAAVFRGLTPLDSYRALNCLTSAVYYEAGSEPEEGQRAVAQVVLNRVRSRLWPDSVCAVVYEGSERTDFRCQFTFSCDGAMARMPNGAGWTRARRIAQQALAGRVYAPVGLATFYHTLAVRPEWSGAMKPVAVVGAHIFYRKPGFDSSPAAFRTPYAGRETQSGPARRIWPGKPLMAGAMPDLPMKSILKPGEKSGAGMSPTAPPTGFPDAGLPESTIRPEYRNTGRPLI